MNLYSTIKTPLMSHQLRLVEAFKRLKVGYLKGDMGTGKTLAMLAVAEQKKRQVFTHCVGCSMFDDSRVKRTN